MFATNPFASVLEFLPPGFMHVFVVVMAAAVATGTVLDMYHKGSATFFLRRREHARTAARRRLSSLHTAAIATRTLAEAAVSGEFCKWKRRASHLLMMYGFILYLVATIALVFAFSGSANAGVWPALWDLGALMIIVGGLWFFLFLRVNVIHEGDPPWRVGRADLFVLLLVGSAAFGLLWHLVQSVSASSAANLGVFTVYLFLTTLLFVSVPWSKFAHMFYKPVVAFQRRVEEADGSSDRPARASRRNGR